MNEIHVVVRVAQGLLALAMVLSCGLFIQLTMP
jgi:hypothetical protein